jgi:hypothetical protein
VWARATGALKPAIALAARLAAMLAVFVALHWWLRHVAHLPMEGYRQPVIALEICRSILFNPLYTLSAAALALGALRYARQLWRPWDQAFDHGRALRWLVVIMLSMSAWTFATYDFNLYYNQPHALDRALLIGLAVLTVWRPIFVLPFLLQLTAVIFQFDYPITGYYPWTHVDLVTRGLTLLGACLIVHAATGSRRGADYVFLLLCLIASSYFGSGVGKFELNWIAHRQLQFLIGGAYSNGWLGFLPPASIATFIQSFQPFVTGLMLFTLVVEWGALVAVWQRSLALAFLLCFVLFHLGVFLVSGMLFWMWIVLEIGVIGLMSWYGRAGRELAIFDRSHFLLSLVLIAGSSVWFKPTNLSWYDTRLYYTYRVEAVGQSGRAYPLPVSEFAPYHDMFTLGNFGWLSDRTQLTHVFGVTVQPEVAQDLLAARTSEDVFALEAGSNRVLRSAERIAQFEEFLSGYFAHLNQQRANPTWWQALQPPRHLWSFPRDGESPFDGQEPIVKAVVYQVTSLYDERSYADIRKRPVLEVDIPIL